MVAALVRVLQSCPDIVAWRKEVLVATRHVMNVMLRTGTPAALRGGCRRRLGRSRGRRGARARLHPPLQPWPGASVCPEAVAKWLCLASGQTAQRPCIC